MTIVVKSQIEGSFEGWNDGQLFEFANGQIWKQTRYKYAYRYMYRPTATVFQDSGRYLLHVDGMTDMVEVERRA